jgi:D-glycero-D-manno-heptose 1,7-bisphosphate phosphatase
MKESRKNRAVFVDRDGTINIDHGYVGQIERFDLIPNALEGLGSLAKAGFLLFVVTNQSGIARKLFTEPEMHALHKHLQELLKPHGAQITEFYVAPELPDTPGSRRKPSPQFLIDAAAKHDLDLPGSCMIGDKAETDILCGRTAGCKTVLVRTGEGRKAEGHPTIKADYVADDLLDAARWILRG